MKKLLLCSLICLHILSGCIQTRIIDEISVVRTVAFDKDEDRLKMSVSFPTFLEQGEQNIQERDVITTTSDTVKGARIKLEQQSQKPLEFGQLNVVLIDKDLATQGVENMIDSLYRDASVGNRITIAVVDDSTEDVLMSNLGGGEQTGVYLSDLIQQNMDINMVPATNMHEFLFSLYNDARDPYLPVISIENDRIKVVGTALFKGELYQRTLNLDDSFIVKLMTSPTKLTTKEFRITTGGEEAIAVVEKIFSKRKRSIDQTGPNLVYKIEIELKGEIIDYTGSMNLEEDNLVNKIEGQIEEVIKNRGEELLAQFRDEGIDPVAIGEKYRSTTRDWDSKRWSDEIYPTVEFEVVASVEILSSGAIE
ncbi:Ger(x)C family spore germination protein [Bacillus sp. FJAT-45037]|uniref:Ger(x)C family spore germination protein n=1 Tax=Bacillus sp. FJAT-45037 TaxID=2011007 RepID=UPI000C241E11|nr:Ger(x)C family spore germination protein [Bacillus sp. FJAT-45037]